MLARTDVGSLAAEKVCAEPDPLTARGVSKNTLCDRLGREMATLAQCNLTLGKEDSCTFANPCDRTIDPGLQSRQASTVKQLFHGIDHHAIDVVSVA
jgi:hypothetical protein